MKDQWYTDDRNLIKWEGLVHLYNSTGIRHVIQVANFREYLWLPLHFNNGEVPIPDNVITHFRSIRDVKRLGKKAGITIYV